MGISSVVVGGIMKESTFKSILFFFGIACITLICIVALLNKIDSAVVGSACSAIAFIITRKRYKK